MKTIFVLTSLLYIFTHVKDGGAQSPVDMLIVLDVSTHMNEGQLWKETQDFINTLVLQRLTISKTVYRIGLITYGKTIEKKWTLGKTKISGNARQIKRRIKDLVPTNGEIKSMADVIDEATAYFKGKHDRAKAPNVVLLFHNRFSCNTTFEGVEQAVEKLVKKAAIFVVVENLEKVDFDQLVSLTPVPDFIFRYQDYRQLLAALSFNILNGVV